MEVKFSWATRGDKNEVCEIIMNINNVPRLEELVNLEVQITQDKWVNKSGRVRDVIWQINGKREEVTVILGA